MTTSVRDGLISVIIPAYDEEASVAPLHDELCALADEHHLDLELVWVDDGSRDGTWAAFERITEKDPRSRAVRLRRNFGKTAALSAGIEAASGETLVTLDADGQDVPGEIVKLLALLDEGADVANGWKRPRQDPWHKVLPSVVFNVLVGLVSGLRLRDHNSGLKALRAEVFEEVKLYGNLHRFIPWLAHARGFTVREVPVAHRPRRFGRSKYGASRFLIGLLDLILVRMLTDARGAVQKVLGLVGVVAAVVGGLALGYLGVLWLLQFSSPATYKPLTERPLTLYALATLVVGAQVMTLGILSGLLPSASTREAVYSVRERRGAEPRGAKARVTSLRA